MTKQQYCGLDLAKFILSILVAMRHIIQIFFTEGSRGPLLIGSWLSNLAVPTFFIVSGFFLFQKIDVNVNSTHKIFKYCKRILMMYFIWSVIYLPIDFYNWYHSQTGIYEGVTTYIHSFFFSSSIVQLWYLPALAFAAWFVWFLYTRKMPIWSILILGFILFTIGCVCDNWYYNEMLPHRLYEILIGHNKYFLTMRNGLYYGTLFLAIGLWFAKVKFRINFLVSCVCALGSLGLMYYEVSTAHNTNMVFTAIPTVFFMVMALIQIQRKENVWFSRLRQMSQWIYLGHFYVFYLFAWTVKWNPVPLNNKNITVMIVGLLIFFSFILTLGSETKRGAFLKKII